MLASSPARLALGGLLAVVLALVLAFSGVCVSCLGAAGLVVADRRDTTEVTVRVQSHEWRRTIGIEELERSRDEDWCADVPDDARVLTRREKLKDRDRVGRRTHSSYAEWCDYEVLRWSRERAAEASGEGVSPEPHWPDVPIETCATEGCRRSGDRDERYTLVIVEEATGEERRCYPDEASWRAFADGTRAVLPVGSWLGIPQCDELRAVP